MTPGPVVSVVIIFLDAGAYLREAIESVLAQTYERWELVLVDDGSTDGSRMVAEAYARSQPGRVRCLEHPGRENRGMSASRNLGVAQSRGKYVAFLDADDVWAPEKLAEQVALLEGAPATAMVCGPGLYWHGWTGRPGDRERDFVQNLKVAPGFAPPPTLVPLYLKAPEATPGICGVLVAREWLERVGGFEGAFRGMYEDQILYVKLGLRAPILVTDRCWYRYRQHPRSACAVASSTGEHLRARLRFLAWVREHLASSGLGAPEVERALAEQWRAVRRATGWRGAARTAARAVLPAPVRRWLREREALLSGARP